MAPAKSKAAVLEKRRFWKTHIEAWQTSGLKQSAYCRKHDLKLNRFIYWRKKYTRAAQPPIPLVELSLPQGFHILPGPRPLRLIIDQRYRVEVERGFDSIALRQLLEALEQL